jgi:diguanylate cyclase (GGDEF)-like protein
MDCPVPPDEARRLKAVHSYDILDTPPEMDFDALTRVAAHAFNTPAAVIGLMDSDRLWFKSQLGLDVPQLDRQIAMCAHALMSPSEAFVVEDLSQDPRFRHNPLVTQSPHLRFYAGVPLVDADGFALGTIAVVDKQPRAFSDAQRASLQDMSRLVISSLENRQRALLLSHLAMTDYLTGLANRVQFERTLNSELAHSRRTGESFTVLYMDLDGFKAINDAFGHAAGDEVLVEVAQRLTRQVRAEDLVSRFGGDEFGVFLRESQQDSDESLIQRIVETVSEPITLASGVTVRIGISVGKSSYMNIVDNLSTLLTRADEALYEVKRKKNAASSAKD